MSEEAQEVVEEKTITLTGHMPVRFVMPWDEDPDYVLITNYKKPGLDAKRNESIAIVSRESAENAPFLDVPKTYSGWIDGIQFNLTLLADEIEEEMKRRVEVDGEGYGVSDRDRVNIFNEMMRGDHPDYVCITGLEKKLRKLHSFRTEKEPYVAARFEGVRSMADFRLRMDVDHTQALENLAEDNRYPIFQVEAKNKFSYGGL